MELIPSAHAVDIADIWQFSDKLGGPQYGTFGGLISSFLPRVLLIAGIIFFILVVIAGFGMITSAGSGDAHAQEQSKAYMTYAVTGLVIIFASYWVLQIISYVTGGSLKGLFGP